MTEVLRIATQVGTPLALLGLIAALAFLANIRRLKFRLEQLKIIPEDQRERAADEYLSRYGIDGANLPIKDKVRLLENELNKRDDRFR